MDKNTMDVILAGYLGIVSGIAGFACGWFTHKKVHDNRRHHAAGTITINGMPVFEFDTDYEDFIRVITSSHVSAHVATVEAAEEAETDAEPMDLDTFKRLMGQ